MTSTSTSSRVGVVTVTGNEQVAKAARFLGPEPANLLLSVPAGDGAGVVAVRGGRIMALFSLTVGNGRIEHIDGIVDPDKLAPIAAALGSR